MSHDVTVLEYGLQAQELRCSAKAGINIFVGDGSA